MPLSNYRLTGAADYAGFADKIGGEMFPEDGDGLYKLIRYEP